MLFHASKAPGSEFQCRYLIGWPEREVRRYTCGLDGLQALMLAIASSIPSLSRVMRIRPDALLGAIRPISTFRPLGVRDRYMTRHHSHKPFNPA
ncbi:DUF6968 family protein [Stakelama flava]|uniref:DUF6968 family protein n=1 Tax=Stakelama flava TaxID=2860338 RepID=UPI003CCEBE94